MPSQIRTQNRRRRGRGNRRRNFRRISRSLVPRFPATVFERTERLADFPPSQDGIFIVNQIIINNLLTSTLSTLSGLYTEYRFTELVFTFQPIGDSNQAGNAFMVFDNRFNIGLPSDIDEVYSRPHFVLIPASDIFLQQRQGTRGHSLILNRSVNNFNWYRTSIDPNNPNNDDTLGVLFFGGDHTLIANIPGHLTVRYRIVLRN